MSTTDTRAAFEAWWESEPDEDKFTFDELALMRRAWNAATEATKATGTEDIYLGEDFPPLPESIEVGGEGWDWKDFQSEKTFSVQHMLHYGAACAQAAFAEAARQPAPVSQIEHERDMLAKGIADAALKAGIWNGEVDLTGPHLLMFCDDLASAALAATAAPVLSSSKINEIYQRTHKHCYDGAAAGNFLREYIAATRSQP